MIDDSTSDADLGGESSCDAHLLCFDCGVVLDGSAHATSCRASMTRENQPLDGCV